MKKTLLVSLAVLLAGMFSITFAQSSVSNHLDEDLYFNDSVHISSGVTYQETLDEGVGTSSVAFEGEGSLTVGKRLGDGFPRIVLYGGTTLTVAQDFGDGPENWWTGNFKSPNKVLNIPKTHIVWENQANHALGERNIAVSYGLESVTDTYQFSSPAYVVLPSEAPNGAKVWYAFHSVDPENPGDPEENAVEVVESNFCIVEDGLCVIEVEEMNQIALIEESFEKCPRDEVANGNIGSIPYCIITCNEGYELDENAIACYEIEGGAGEEPIEAESIEDPVVVEEAQEVENHMDDEAWKGRYRDSALELVNTEGLEGKELRDSLRYNAEVNRRKVEKDKKSDGEEKISVLSKTLRDISAKLWSWENRSPGKIIAETGELELNGGEVSEGGEVESYSSHASAPLLPSTGSSAIFIIVSILGIGLMLLAFKRQ